MTKRIPNNPIPQTCACGCGQQVPKAKFPSQQRRYISGHQPTLPRPLAERFWEKVDRRGPADCWEWQGALDTRGYGDIKVGKGKIARAHRVSYLLAHGSIDPNLAILHSCDNRKCVNPAHLSLGTIADNLRDMRQKNRHVHGETHKYAKLTAAQVEEIRSRYAAGGVLQRELAQEFGVSTKHIGRIINYDRWT